MKHCCEDKAEALRALQVRQRRMLIVVLTINASMFLIEGNMSGDKKLSQLSLVAGRGTRVTAECFLDRGTVESVLKTTPEMLDRAQRCALLGSQQSGMLGYNVNVAGFYLQSVPVLFAALGWDGFDGAAEQLCDYFPSSGSGQVNVEFHVGR